MNNRLALCMAGAALCAATPAFAGDGKNLIKMIPADSQIVLVFDVADARDSALLQKGYDSLLAAKPDAKAKLAEIGLDPLKDIDTVLFAGAAKGEDFDDMANMVVVIEGRIPKDKLATIPGAKASKYNAATTIWTQGDSDFAVFGDRLFFTQKGKMKSALDLAAGKAKGKSADGPKGKKLRDAIGNTDTTADLWLTVLVPAKAKADMLKQQGMSADVVSLGVNFTADIAAAMRIATDSEATAQKAVSMIQGQLAQVSQMAGTIGLAKAAKSLLVSSTKANVDVSLTITDAELQSIMKLAGMGGGTGGGMQPAGGSMAPPPPTRGSGSTMAPPATTGTAKPKTP